MSLSRINNRENSKEEKYIKILDAAEYLIKDKGLAALSISKVAKQAKIAKGTTYLYFENKEEIIAGLTIRAREILLEYFKKYCESTDDPIKKIENIFWADYYFMKEQHTYHELVAFYEQNTGLKETKELSSASRTIANYVSSIIENAKENKAIRPDVNSSLQGFLFWGMGMGVLQIIDTKGDQLSKYFGLSEKEFFQHFIDSALLSIQINKK